MLKGKKFEAEFSRLFKVHGNQAQFNIFDLSKIRSVVNAANVAGEDLEAAMVKAVATYRADRAQA